VSCRCLMLALEAVDMELAAALAVVAVSSRTEDAASAGRGRRICGPSTKADRGTAG
jgi:hypothetical protein